MSQHYSQFHDFLAENVVTPFYLRRLQGLQSIRLGDVLKRKNPYLFKAKNLETTGELARSVVDAFLSSGAQRRGRVFVFRRAASWTRFLSSQEETLFGDLMETFAVHMAATLWNGHKSRRVGLDLEFERDGKYYIVEIKSGVNWGNSSQIKRMKENFKSARLALRRETAKEIVAVNGCIYGKEARPLKTDAADADKTYFKYAGQDFWQFLSGDDNLFREIIKPIDQEAREKDAAFQSAYAAKINELTAELSLNFLSDGQIDWIKLVEFVSGRQSAALKSAASSEAIVAQAKATVGQ